MSKNKATKKAKKVNATDRHLNPRESFHLPAELQQRLEEYAASRKPASKKSAVLRYAVEKLLDEEENTSEQQLDA